ncbi:MAG: DUF3021 domain-containing protein [Actinomycetaceae bacterium]|nr:DUF3021 domain-containing protein [Actinomycetaceae bacterium]
MARTMTTKQLIGFTITGAAIGVTIGTTIELIFSYIFSYIAGAGYSPGVPAFLEQFQNSNNAVLIERMIYALYGVVCAFAGILYKNQTRPLVLTSAMHFGIILITGLAAGAYLKWWTSGIELLGIIGTIAVVYLLIWLGIFLSTRAEVKRINNQLS